jgi:glycosyltransferase involved in cell wall biosynthesis
MLKIFSPAGADTSKKLGEVISAADEARDGRNWPEAAQLYRKALDIDGSLTPIWVQYGHALKESGDLAGAETAYRQALSLDEGVADTHVQLGHLLKIAGRKADALECYKRALQLSPNDPSVKKEIEACEKSLGSKFYQTSGSHHLYFDISDLIFYIGHHNNLTGIQRVQASIIMGLLNLDLNDVVVHFLTYVNSQRSFYEIDQAFAVSLLYDLSLEPAARQIQFDKQAARDGYIREAVPLEPAAGDTRILCILGAAWVNRDYFLRVRNLKQKSGFRFLCLIHDLIPIFARETCDQGTAEVFTNFLLQSYHAADGYLCVSQSTKNDLIRFFAKQGWSIPDPVVTQNGALLPPVARPCALKSIDPDLETRNYILFVSTIEGRKNHLTAFKAFEKLLSERDDVPYLVCVGRLGWRAEDFLLACQASDFLHGKIKILSEISDNELAALYKNSLLTIYPSLYEGWGLPVGEALSFGKVCITSRTTSLPEAGGEFAHYIDPAQFTELAAAISYYLDNPKALEETEARIRTQYHAVEWKEVASKVIGACLSKPETPAKSGLPVVEPGREYPICPHPKLPPNLMGERMAEAISSTRRRLLIPGYYRDADYLPGQDARLGEGWCELEDRFTWMRANGAELAFAVSNVSEERLVMYIAYHATPPCIGATLTVDSSRLQALSYEITRPSGHLVIQGLKPIKSEGAAHVFIRFRIRGAGDLEEKLKAHDGRSPAIAIRSFAVIPESDFSARLNILENLSSA